MLNNLLVGLFTTRRAGLKRRLQGSLLEYFHVTSKLNRGKTGCREISYNLASSVKFCGILLAVKISLYHFLLPETQYKSNIGNKRHVLDD